MLSISKMKKNTIFGVSHGKEQDDINRREYIRLDTVFPVGFKLYSSERDKRLSQGFTRNISDGGMCLEVKELENEFIQEITKTGMELDLFIEMPHKDRPINAKASIRWLSKVEADFPDSYMLGVEYIENFSKEYKQIINYAKKLRRRPKIIGLIICLLISIISLFYWYAHNITIEKGVAEVELLHLRNEFVAEHKKKEALEKKLYVLNINKNRIENSFLYSKRRIDKLEKELFEINTIRKGLNEELDLQRVGMIEEKKQMEIKIQSLLKKLVKINSAKSKLIDEIKSIKELDNVEIVKIRLTNGNWITGQLLDVTGEKLELKVGMGSVGVDRNMISELKEVSKTEKINIQKEWQREEKTARLNQEKWEEFVSVQNSKGLVYFNGSWIKKEAAEVIREELKLREIAAYEFISGKQYESFNRKEKDLTLLLKQADRNNFVSTDEKNIYLNGRKFYVKGVGYGIEYPGTAGGIEAFKEIPFEIFQKDFKMMKEAGINTIRTYEPLPSRLLDLAEEYGIMVIENLCYPDDYTDFDSKVHLSVLKEKIRRYVSRDKKRKCILMWSIWNDAPWAWGSQGNVVERFGFHKVNNFLKELYDTVKQYDISHPVTASNAINLNGENLGWDFLDIVGLNIYLGGYDWFVREDAVNQSLRMNEIQARYNKPVIILETGSSTYIEGQDQGDILIKQIGIASTSEIAGITIFQWADGWQKTGDEFTLDDHIEEHWGILDGYRNPKSGYTAVSKLFTNMKTKKNENRKE